MRVWNRKVGGEGNPARSLCWLVAPLALLAVGCGGDERGEGSEETTTAEVTDSGLDTSTSASETGETHETGETGTTDTGEEPVLLTCPTSLSTESIGTLGDGALNEVSGVAISRATEGLLWVHNDSGDAPVVYAIAEDGSMLGTWELAGAPAGDFEDIAIASRLFIGDVGDNGRVRDAVRVHIAEEPAVSLEAGGSGTLDFITVELNYPDGPEDVEAMWVDPVNEDIYLLAKILNVPSTLYRKSAPHVDGSTTTLEAVGEIDLSTPPHLGIATAADLSPDGRMLVVRGYVGGWMWLVQPGETLLEAITGEPCALDLPIERQSESIGFTPDGAALISISEGAEQPVNLVTLEWELTEGE